MDSLIICHKQIVKIISAYIDTSTLTVPQMEKSRMITWEQPSDLLKVLDSVRECAPHAGTGDINVLISTTETDQRFPLFFAILTAFLKQSGLVFRIITKTDENVSSLTKDYLDALCL